MNKVAELNYEKVKAEDNRRVMLDSKLVATSDGGIKVFQSENRNVITIIKDGYYYHICLEDIVEAVLKDEGCSHKEIK